LNPDWRNRYEAAVEAARHAGRVALNYFDQDVAVEWKADESPVTVADRETEASLRATFERTFPGDGFLGEEYGDTPSSTGYRWIIDPIDGTRSFVRGVPIWATMIGLEYKGEQIAGVVHLPALGQTYHALRGDGAFRDSKRIRVSDVSDLAHAHVYYSSLSWFMKAGKQDTFIDLCLRSRRGRANSWWSTASTRGTCRPWSQSSRRPAAVSATGMGTSTSTGRTSWSATASSMTSCWRC